jgi:hypothetical protein
MISPSVSPFLWLVTIKKSEVRLELIRLLRASVDSASAAKRLVIDASDVGADLIRRVTAPERAVRRCGRAGETASSMVADYQS